ncbi:MAG: hypothetical protein GEU74_08500 [Nitriliruptorales bacterium]|nr:hypothetical protein [Nitriliruptorales bacterium]
MRSGPDVAHTLVDLPALWAAGILLASIIHLNRRPGENTPPTVGRTLGLAVLAAGVLVNRMSSLLDAPLLGGAAADQVVAVWLIEAAVRGRPARGVPWRRGR